MKLKSLNLYAKTSILVGLVILSFLTFWFVNASPDATKQNAIQTISSNDVNVSLMSVDTTASQVKSEVCIDLPDNGDWLPYAYIEIKGEQIPVEEVSLMNAKNPDTYANSSRCYEFKFPAEVTDDVTEVKVVVEKLQINLPEFLTEEMCLEAEKEIQNTYADFSFSCEIGKQGVGFTVSGKPQDMTEDQANQLIFEALTETVEGPWELVHNLK